VERDNPIKQAKRGGPSGARSRDLRIKRPDCHNGPRLVFSAAKNTDVSIREPSLNVSLENREIPFAVDSVVEITSGMSKGQRGVVLGPARSMYRGVPDVRVRKENGDESWIRPDYLRSLP
jgi:hypothetical protein